MTATATATAIGLASVPIGVTAWARIDPLSDAGAKGGHVWSTSEAHDPDTGQPYTLLHCLRIKGGRPDFLTLREDEVNTDLLRDERPNTLYVRDAVRACLRTIAARKGAWTDEDRHLLGVAHRLAVAVLR